jgi:small redox-active disulfide protein 2
VGINPKGIPPPASPSTKQPGKEYPMKKIQILGTGCPKCKKLYNNAKEAADALGIDYELIKVEDIMEIAAFGVMMTPALAIDGEVKLVGKVPSPEDLKIILG